MIGGRGRGGFKTPAAVSMDSKLRAKQRAEPGVSYLVLTRAVGINPSLTESCGSVCRARATVFGRCRDHDQPTVQSCQTAARQTTTATRTNQSTTATGGPARAVVPSRRSFTNAMSAAAHSTASNPKVAESEGTDE